jgi:SAM-dependent methyltransferase
MTHAREQWDVGEAYEAYIGRWSRPVAEEFLGALEVPPGRRWLDVGCGTGALTATVLGRAEPAEVVGIDPSAGFLGHARARIADDRASFLVADARSLPFPDGRFGAAVSGLALNFVPGPDTAVAELVRVVSSGGVAAAYVWDYADGMAMLRYFWDAAVTLVPTAAELDEGSRFPLCRPERLQRLWEDAGLRDVAVRAIDIPTVFTDFDDFWQPFLGGQGPAPGYVKSLPGPQAKALHDLLRDRLPVAPDGTIPLTARAWSVSGTA